jgi:DNA repair ATPase RecN
MQELQLLNDKLDTLLKKYAALQAENNSLKDAVSKQLQTIDTLNGKLTTMEEHMAGQGLNNALGEDKERVALRKKLDGVIGEIDKILNTLND